MLKVIIDKQNGIAVPDAAVRETVDAFIVRHKGHMESGIHTYEVSISQGILLDALRLAVRYEQIALKDIEFYYEDKLIPVDKDGRMANYPFDEWSIILEHLLGW